MAAKKKGAKKSAKKTVKKTAKRPAKKAASKAKMTKAQAKARRLEGLKKWHIAQGHSIGGAPAAKPAKAPAKKAKKTAKKSTKKTAKKSAKKAKAKKPAATTSLTPTGRPKKKLDHRSKRYKKAVANVALARAVRHSKLLVKEGVITPAEGHMIAKQIEIDFAKKGLDHPLAKEEARKLEKHVDRQIDVSRFGGMSPTLHKLPPMPKGLRGGGYSPSIGGRAGTSFASVSGHAPHRETITSHGAETLRQGAVYGHSKYSD